MGIKSRLNYLVTICAGCLDAGSDRCKVCLGRPKDKRKKSSKGIDDASKSN